MLKGLVIGAALLLLSARPASAQLSAGYAMVDWNGCCAHGFMVDYAHQIHTMGPVAFGAVGDFGLTRFSNEETDTTYSGGGRFTFLKDTKVPVHAQVLAGVVHWSEDAFEGFPGATGNDFILGFGGGATYNFTKMFGVKPQVDWFIVPAQNGADSDWFFRFTINGVINLHR